MGLVDCPYEAGFIVLGTVFMTTNIVSLGDEAWFLLLNQACYELDSRV